MNRDDGIGKRGGRLLGVGDIYIVRQGILSDKHLGLVVYSTDNYHDRILYLL